MEFSKKTLFSIFLYLFLDLLAFTLILPWLPTIIESHSESEDPFYLYITDVANKLRQLSAVENTPHWDSVLFGGVLASIFSLTQFISSPIFGAFSDLFGRKPILIVLQLCTVASYAVWATAGASFTSFAVSRLLCGATKANVGVLSAAISDTSHSGTRTRGMAVIGVAYSLAFLIGPAASAMGGAWLVWHVNGPAPPARFPVATDPITTQTGDVRGPALGALAVLLSLLSLMVLYTMVPETLPKQAVKKVNAFDSMKKSLKLMNPFCLFSFSSLPSKSSAGDGDIRGLALFYFVYLLVFSGLEFTLIFLTRSRFNYTSKDQGKMFFFIGVIMVLIQGGFIRRFKLGKEKAICLSAMLTLSVSFGVLALASRPDLFYFGLSLLAYASASFVPCCHTLASLMTDSRHQGHVMGVFRSLSALARAVGPLCFACFFWATGSTISFGTGALVIVLLGLMFARSNVGNIGSGGHATNLPTFDRSDRGLSAASVKTKFSKQS